MLSIYQTIYYLYWTNFYLRLPSLSNHPPFRTWITLHLELLSISDLNYPVSRTTRYLKLPSTSNYPLPQTTLYLKLPSISILFLLYFSAYETLAVGVLDECRKENDDLAQNIVIKELANFGNLSNLDIAVTADHQEFVAHPSCQTLLSRFWMGSLYINTTFWRV